MRIRVWWLCVICLGIMTARAGADSIQKHLETAAAAYDAGDYQKCVDHYGAAIELGTSNPDVLYNAACCCAMNDDIDLAFVYLEDAVKLGYHNTQWLSEDTDLKSLHIDDRWLNLVEKCTAADESYLQTINRELYLIYQADQGDRLQGGAELDWSQIVVHDSLHRSRVQQMLDSGLVVAADDYFHAAMIFQHGIDSSSYLLARELALKAVDLDSTNSIAKWLSAAAQDRYLWSVGAPQWYGTQLHPIDGIWTIDPIDTTVISDEERLRWFVPTLEEARRKADEMNGQ